MKIAANPSLMRTVARNHRRGMTSLTSRGVWLDGQRLEGILARKIYRAVPEWTPRCRFRRRFDSKIPRLLSPKNLQWNGCYYRLTRSKKQCATHVSTVSCIWTVYNTSSRSTKIYNPLIILIDYFRVVSVAGEMTLRQKLKHRCSSAWKGPGIHHHF